MFIIIILNFFIKLKKFSYDISVQQTDHTDTGGRGKGVYNTQNPENAALVNVKVNDSCGIFNIGHSCYCHL